MAKVNARDPLLPAPPPLMRQRPSRAEQLYAALSATNEALLRAGSASAEALCQRVCAAVVESGLIAAAAVLHHRAGNPLLQLTASQGPADLAGVRVSIDENDPAGRGLAGRAFRSGQSQVSQDLLADARVMLWRHVATGAGLRACAAVPLLREGRCAAVLVFYSPQAGAFDTATVGLLERLADNLGHALAGQERDAERDRLADSLSRFRAAIDLSGDAVYLTDFETLRFVDVNETACRRGGFTREEMLRRGPTDTTTNTEAEIRAMMQQAIDRAPACVVAQQEGVRRDGSRWASEVSRRALRSGGRWLIVSIGRDVEERRRQERLQGLQLSVSHRLAGDGALPEVLAEVLADLGQGLGLFAGACDVAAESGAWRRLALWTAPAAAAQPAVAAAVNATSATTTPGADAAALPPPAPPHGEGVHRRAVPAGLLLAVPLAAAGQTLGVLHLGSAGPVSRADVDPVLAAMGEQLGQYLLRKRAESVLSRSEARFRALTELSSDWYWESDAQMRFTSFGGRHISDTGLRDWRNDFFGRTVWEMPNVVPDSADWLAHRQALARRQRFDDFQFAVRTPSGKLRWTSASGEPVFDDMGRFSGYCGVSRDITERRTAEDSIRHLATHDTLTGLPNRALFTETLVHWLNEARHEGTRLALLFIDLDHFKIINDTLGHDAGDQLLTQMARALRESLRPEDLVARLGGDEFVVLLRRPQGTEEAAVVAHKLLGAATQPWLLEGQECRVSASVGICMFPDAAGDEAALMKGADIAMYEAKRAGRNAYRFFANEAPPQTLRRLQLESALRTALAQHELSLHYQPKIDLHSGRIIGAEALLRWNSPALGAVSPAEFIPLAEETGLILSIGRWVLRTACEQHVAWRAAGLPPVPLAVNLSPRQFADEELLPDIRRVLHDTGLAAQMLELEITEGMVIADPQRALRTVQAIKRMGVRLAIDDFGTGYSSLAQLKRYPIDTLKIDRSLVCGLPGDVFDAAITDAIVVMSRALALTVVAEGVETVAQREFLLARGCQQMQGYQFSKPLPAHEFAALVRRHRAG